MFRLLFHHLLNNKMSNLILDSKADLVASQVINLSTSGYMVSISKPETIDDIVNHTTGRCLDLFEIDTSLVKRWAGMGKQVPSTPQNS